MFAKIPEKYLHRVRWGLAISWLILIASLFFDPISEHLTKPKQIFASANSCFMFQEECEEFTTYPLGARCFWGMIVPTVIIILLVFGHEAWRRICPLSFMSQIPRALGWQRKMLIKEDSWLHRHHLYLQMGLLFLGLNIRLLLVNSDRFLLGIFLLCTILSAIVVGFLYGGKTWCNYFCPMAPVQMIYSEPSGLLGSDAHTQPPMSITQSMCRTVASNGQEKSACVACKSPCMDIDAEYSYWSKINQPDRKLLYYGYLGLVIGFYLYFGLYSGNWSFLSGGVWNETNQLATLLNPGFYFDGWAIPIPKLVAVPLTLTLFSGLTYAFGLWLEKAYKRYNKRLKHPLSLEQLHHNLFTLFTFAAFNLLFFLGVRPTLGWLPLLSQNLLSWGAVLVSGFWLVKTWHRSLKQYEKERDANLLRRQLQKLEVNFPDFLEGRSLEDLNPHELYALAKVLPGFSHQYRIQIYTNVIREAIEQHRVSAVNSLRFFDSLRQQLSIKDDEHWPMLDQLAQDYPNLFAYRLGNLDNAEMTLRRANPGTSSTTELTQQRFFNPLSTNDRTQKLPFKKITSSKSTAEPTVQRPFLKRPKK